MLQKRNKYKWNEFKKNYFHHGFKFDGIFVSDASIERVVFKARKKSFIASKRAILFICDGKSEAKVKSKSNSRFKRFTSESKKRFIIVSKNQNFCISLEKTVKKFGFIFCFKKKFPHVLKLQFPERFVMASSAAEDGMVHNNGPSNIASNICGRDSNQGSAPDRYLLSL